MDGFLCHLMRNNFWCREIVRISYALHSADLGSALKQLHPHSSIWKWGVVHSAHMWSALKQLSPTVFSLEMRNADSGSAFKQLLPTVLNLEMRSCPWCWCVSRFEAVLCHSIPIGNGELSMVLIWDQLWSCSFLQSTVCKWGVGADLGRRQNSSLQHF